MDLRDMDSKDIMTRMASKDMVNKDMVSKDMANNKDMPNNNKAIPQILHSRNNPLLVNRGSLLRSLQTLRSQGFSGLLI